jgi:hypothetical protein
MELIQMSKIDDRLEDIIKRLPPELRELARKYAGILKNIGRARLEELFQSLFEGDWRPTYDAIVDAMPTQERLKELRAIKSNLRRLNREAAQAKAAQMELVKDFWRVLIAIAMAEL